MPFRKAEPEPVQDGSVSCRLRACRKALSAKSVGEYIGCSTTQVYKLARSGRIPSRRPAGMVKFDPVEVAEWWDKSRMA